MGIRGPKPSRSDGYTLTAKGYLRARFGKRQRMVHDVVWERAHGPIPAGHDVHHRNENKQDNRIANLELLTKTEHKRVHGGCERRDGQWWKPCGTCKELKPLTEEHFYFSREGWPQYNRCRPCHIKAVVEAKRRRRARRAGA